MSTKCLTPFLKKDQNIPLPCGRCPGCVAKRVSGWSFRLMQEEKRSSSALFVTMTYDTRYVPITKKGFMSVSKTDLQKFFKRLRKLNNYGSIKYYAAAEYGSKSYRPHYHIILFNAKHENVITAWKQDGKEIGSVHFGTVTEASIGYSLKYISKPKRIPLHTNDDREPEFALMSKKLGNNYITEEIHRWHKSDLENRMYIPLKDGKKAPIPRYIKEKLYSKEQLGWLKGIMEGVSLDREIENHQYENYDERKVQADLAAFRKMYKSSTKNTTI